MGKNKYIETPQKMWELFTKYKEDVDSNPLTRKDWVGKDAEVVNREFTRALTMEGFECFVMNHTEITYPDLTEYFEGKNESYKDYFPICSRIRREIRKDQLEKGLAGLINPSITQRLNGLVDKKDLNHKGVKLGQEFESEYKD
ncbi:conserved hypothetical protein [Tenacibaculum sp. 190524A05c]|uniref:terminase small subunit n=1 Tax=Tenacibaculum platacis TaxID=3137852 RepID=UPI0031FAA0C9